MDDLSERLSLTKKSNDKYGNFFGKIVKRLYSFGDNSNLHGVRHVLSSKSINIHKRALWLTIMTLSAIGMVYVMNQGSDLFVNRVISFVPETTHLHWNTDFPAITICETTDSSKLSDYYLDFNIPTNLTTVHKEIIFLDSHYCRSCSICKEIAGCPEDFYDVIRKYRSPCNETLARCSWSGQPFDCCDRFMSMDTEYGECFVFNSAHFPNDRMHLSNRISGPGYLKFAAMEAIDVHSPDDVIYSNFDKPIINGNDAHIRFASEFELRIKVEETTNDDMVEKVPAHIRRCLFAHEEPSIRMYSRYSYSVCIVQCRARKQMANCNCTHHMLPRIDDEPICDIDGLICLTKLIEPYLENDDLDVDCNCLPSCNEPSYHANLIKNKPNTEALTEELIERGSLISIYMECLPSTRVRRRVVRASLDYVVFVGGTAGVFFGASVLSVIEIFYLLFIRKY